MKRTRRLSEAEEYLRQYPELERWLNRCALCGATGHKPDMPENIYPHFSVAGTNLRRLFKPLDVDALGRCEDCSIALDAAR
jgi:hypothetical protein